MLITQKLYELFYGEIKLSAELWRAGRYSGELFGLKYDWEDNIDEAYIRFYFKEKCYKCLYELDEDTDEESYVVFEEIDPDNKIQLNNDQVFEVYRKISNLRKIKVD